MQEWVHTCSDLGSGQVVAFRAHTFFNGCKMHCIGSKKIVMHEWIYICSDVDNGQKVKKFTRTFCELGMRPLISFLNLSKKKLRL
jgi:hypothetical protein